MDYLDRLALTTLPWDRAGIDKLVEIARKTNGLVPFPPKTLLNLCASHERLRMEVEGATALAAGRDRLLAACELMIRYWENDGFVVYDDAEDAIRKAVAEAKGGAS